LLQLNNQLNNCAASPLAPISGPTWFLRAIIVHRAMFLSGMNTVSVNLTNDVLSGLVINEADDHLTLVDSSFWIPISCTSGSTEFEIDNVESIQKQFSVHRIQLCADNFYG
jgi:hypothetical protein